MRRGSGDRTRSDECVEAMVIGSNNGLEMSGLTGNDEGKWWIVCVAGACARPWSGANMKIQKHAIRRQKQFRYNKHIKVMLLY